MYLPIWTFALGGGIDYTGERTSDVNDSLRRHAAAPEQIHDRYPVMLKLSVAASRRPSAPFVQLLPGFDLDALQPYDARYLAAWPAELYDVPMAEASLEARSQAYASVQRELPDKLAPIRVISTSSANLVVESFQLHLLPVWVCEIRLDGHGAILLINGQTGAVAGQGLNQRPRPKRGLMEWLGDLVAE